MPIRLVRTKAKLTDLDDANHEKSAAHSRARKRAGHAQVITPLGRPQVRTCTVVHTARQVMFSLRDGTPSGSQSVAGADDARETD